MTILTDCGFNLVSINFGECHSLGNDPILASAYFSAIHSFGKSLLGKDVNKLSFGHLNVLFRVKGPIITLIVTDEHEDEEKWLKLERITDLFFEKYGDLVRNQPNGVDRALFEGFSNLLKDLNFDAKDCGNNQLCSSCPKRIKAIPKAETPNNPKVENILALF